MAELNIGRDQVIGHWAEVEYATVYETAGTLNDESGLQFSPGVSSCGPILDGIVFAHKGLMRGGWVVSFASLEDMYKRALKVRGKRFVEPEVL